MKNSLKIHLKSTLPIQLSAEMWPINGCRAIRFSVAREGYDSTSLVLEIPLSVREASQWPQLERVMRLKVSEPFVIGYCSEVADDWCQMEEALQRGLMSLTNDLLRVS